MTTDEIRARLEALRTEIRAERISYGEIAELQGLAEHIEPGDVELLQWAGVPEGHDPRIVVGASYTDDSHPDEPTFTVISYEDREADDPSVELDNGQWYELAGPDGLIAKLDAGIVRRTA